MGTEYLDDTLTFSQFVGEMASGVFEGGPKLIAATATDYVTTALNSALGIGQAIGLASDDTEPLYTEDVLAKVSTGLSDYYLDNKDLVNTLSFGVGLVGGVGAGIKGVNLARAGVQQLGHYNGANRLGQLAQGTVDVFSGSKKKQLTEAMEQVFSEAGAASATYKKLKYSLYADAAVNFNIDNVAAELAIVGTLNAHPYMGDYMEDVGTNMMHSLAIGAAFTPLAMPAIFRHVKNVVQPIEKKSWSFLKDLKVSSEQFGEANAAIAQVAESNMKFLHSKLLDPAILPLEKTNMQKVLEGEQVKHAEALKRLTPEWNELTPEVKDQIKALVGREDFSMIDRIRPVKFGEARHVKTSIELTESSATTGLETFAKGKKFSTVYFHPETNTWHDKEGILNTITAASLKDTRFPKTISYRLPNNEFELEFLVKAENSGKQDLQFLAELNNISRYGVDDLNSALVVSPTDLPRLNAIVSWAAKHPEDAKKLKVNMRSDMPGYDKVELQTKYVDGQTSVASDYWDKITHATKEITLLKEVKSSQAKRLLDQFQSGFMGELRRAMDNFLRYTSIPESEKINIAAAEEIFSAGNKYRQAARTIADKEGYIYLYRGLSGEAKGAGAVESFTPSKEVAATFGNPRLYKIHVDNIIGAIGDNWNEMEVLVGSPAHATVKSLPHANSEVIIKETMKQTDALKGIDDIVTSYTKETERYIREAMKVGNFSFDEIAARLNVTKSAAMHVAAGGSLDDFPAQAWRRYTDWTKVPEYLDPQHGLFAISSNRFKNPLPEWVSNLDASTYQHAHMEFMENLVLRSNSGIAKAAFNIYDDKEMIRSLQMVRSWINELGNTFVGNPRWQSADNMIRDLKGSKEMPIKGEILTFTGKQVVEVMDKITKDLMTPLIPHFKPLTNASLPGVEFAGAMNFVAGLKGMRQMVIHPETGHAFFVQGKIPQNADINDLLKLAARDSDGSVFYVRQKETIAAMESMQAPARELFKFHNMLREFRGMAPLSDLGFYVPPPSLLNKHYSYARHGTGRTEILIAGSEGALKDAETAFLQANPKGWQVISKARQQEFNLVHGYADGDPFITQANIAMEHGGSSKQAITPQPEEFINQIFSGFEYQIKSSVRKFNELYLHDITGVLDRMSVIYDEGQKAQPLFGIAKTRLGGHNGPTAIKNLLLGRDNREISTTWKTLDDAFDLGLTLASQGINKTVGAFQSFGGSKDAKKVYDNFQKLDAQLKELNIPNPWETFNIYEASLQKGATKNIGPKAISVSNSLSALFQLRLFDAAFLIANTLSIPILGTAALTQGFANVATGKGKMFAPLKLMMDGIAHRWSSEGKRMQAIFEAEGHINQAVRQYAEVTGLLNTVQRATEPTEKILEKVDNFVNSDIMKKLASPADFVENFSREMAMHIGFATAKRAYPGIGDKGATILAVNYADRAIGNYFAAQRPVFFQGSLGSAISLYQTYMLTYAQSLFRDLEVRNFQNLARTFLSQAGIFGLNSLPGYNALSEVIGKHYSQEHTDLTTGAYRAFGDTKAELLLYGLPSNILFDSALYTRGDVTPRVPSVDNVAVYNTLVRGIEAVQHGINGVSSAEGFGDKLRALGESVSLQTINRPMARWAEVAMRNSITRQGNTVQTPAEVWTISGVLSRVLALRPIEEQKIRQAIHLQTSYGTADHQNRQKVIEKLRTALRNDNLNSDLIEEAAHDYIRNGGTSKGFDAAINNVMLRTNFGARVDLAEKLEPNSAVRRLISDNY